MYFQGTTFSTLLPGFLIAGIAASLVQAPISMAAEGANSRPEFSLPLDCTKGPRCFVQSLVDMDNGPGIRDPFCHSATYNTHKGTDFRVRNLTIMERGVNVLSMADGIVKATRDGMGDKLVVKQPDYDAVKGRECGNGVVIDHGVFGTDHYSTQICHMAKGSIRVKKGDKVQRGQPLGQIGLSGLTQFPHIHVSIRKNGKIIEPFTGRLQGQPCTTNDTHEALFSKTALAEINAGGFEPLMQSGFAGGPVRGSDLLADRVVSARASGPLVFYANFINLRAGDRIRLFIDGPNGPYSDTTTKPLKTKKATYTAFAGSRKPPGSGRFTGKAELIRNGAVVFSGPVIPIEFD